MLYYIRDNLGKLIGFKKDNETYFYQKNIQENITGIYRSGDTSPSDLTPKSKDLKIQIWVYLLQQIHL